MKFRNLIFFVAGALCVPAIMFARQEKRACAPEKPPARISIQESDLPPPPPPPHGELSRDDARMLKKLFLMSDAELRRLREFIGRLEKMPPELRKKIAADIERSAAAKTPEQRRAFEKHMRERFHRESRDLLARYFSTLPPEHADAERKKFLSLSPKERRAYMREVRKKLGYDK